MNKAELKQLSLKFLGSESKYVKLMEHGVRVPKMAAVTIPGGNPDGTDQVKMVQEKNNGVPIQITKRYSLEEIVSLFTDFQAKEDAKKEQERLEALASSVRAATGVSNQ